MGTQVSPALGSPRAPGRPGHSETTPHTHTPLSTTQWLLTTTPPSSTHPSPIHSSSPSNPLILPVTTIPLPTHLFPWVGCERTFFFFGGGLPPSQVFRLETQLSSVSCTLRAIERGHAIPLPPCSLPYTPQCPSPEEPSFHIPTPHSVFFISVEKIKPRKHFDPPQETDWDPDCGGGSPSTHLPHANPPGPRIPHYPPSLTQPLQPPGKANLAISRCPSF